LNLAVPDNGCLGHSYDLLFLIEMSVLASVVEVDLAFQAVEEVFAFGETLLANVAL
jgi:hypothetical protein